jgi:hypothetical protein
MRSIRVPTAQDAFLQPETASQPFYEGFQILLTGAKTDTNTAYTQISG